MDSYAAFFIAYKARTLIRMPMFSRDDQEDLEQDMLLYYLLSMPDFDPQKGDKRSFIKTVVNRKALMLVRDAEREKRWTGAQNFSLSFQIGDEDDGNTLADIRDTYCCMINMHVFLCRDLMMTVCESELLFLRKINGRNELSSSIERNKLKNYIYTYKNGLIKNYIFFFSDICLNW